MVMGILIDSLLEQGDTIVQDLLRRSSEWLAWIETISPHRRNGSLYSHYLWLQTMQRCLMVAAQYEKTAILNQYHQQYEHYIQQHQ